MNRKILYILSGALLIPIYFFTKSYFTQKPAPDVLKGPAYYEQFKKMRLAGLSEAPEGLFERWNKESQMLSKNGLNLIDSVKELGPFNVGGRTRALLIDKMNINRIIAGGVSGGLWISENRGLSWNKYNDNELNLNITCITQDPNEPANIYYGTGEGAGNSSAAPGAGIFKSTDGGTSFNRLSSTANANFEYCWSIKNSHINKDEVYVSTNNRGVFRTKDGGATWNKIFATTTPVHDMEVFPDGSIMLAIKSLGVYKSYSGDSGTFFRLTDGLQLTGVGRIELAYCRNFPNVVYAALSNSSDNGLAGFYRSSDTGATWVARANPDVSNTISFSFTWYCIAMGVQDNDSNSLMLASIDIGYSKNGGTTWAKADNSHSDYHTMITHPSDFTTVLIGNDGGVHQYKWATPAADATSLNNGYNVTQFYHGAYAPTGLTVIGGTQDNGSHFSLNAAKVFKKLMGADGAYAAVNQQNPNVGYVSTQNGMISRTDELLSSSPDFYKIRNELDVDDDGDIDDGAWFINPYTVNQHDGFQLFFPTKRKLWRSVNGGESWAPVTKNINISTSQEVYTVALSNHLAPTAYVGGSGGLIYRINNVLTDTAGMEKSLRNTAPTEVKLGFISCIRVHPRNHNTIFVSLSNYSDKPRLWKVTQTDRDSAVWESISGNLPTSLPVGSFDLHPDSPDSVIVAGTDFGVYVTNDKGQTWTKDTRIPNVVVDVVTIRPTDRKAFVFTHGRGAWVMYLQSIQNNYVSVKEPAHALANSAIKVYPNPAADYIMADLPGTGDRNIEIFSLDGKRVHSGHYTHGERISVATLPRGVYFIRATQGTWVNSAKFVKY